LANPPAARLRPRTVFAGGTTQHRIRIQIDLKRFEIEGVDGPALQRDSLVFDLYLLFAPAENSQ